MTWRSPLWSSPHLPSKIIILIYFLKITSRNRNTTLKAAWRINLEVSRKYGIKGGPKTQHAHISDVLWNRCHYIANLQPQCTILVGGVSTQNLWRQWKKNNSWISWFHEFLAGEKQTSCFQDMFGRIWNHQQILCKVLVNELPKWHPCSPYCVVSLEFCCHKNMNRGTNKHQYLSTSSATKLGGVELRNFDEPKTRKDSERAYHMNQGPVWVIQGTICVFLFRSATCVCSNKWPKTTNLPYDQTPFHYIHYIHFSAWHTLTVSYAYPKPLVNEPIDLPSLRLAAWYFENHWSSTISPCDPGSPPQGSTVAVDPSSTGLSWD